MLVQDVYQPFLKWRHLFLLLQDADSVFLLWFGICRVFWIGYRLQWTAADMKVDKSLKIYELYMIITCLKDGFIM